MHGYLTIWLRCIIDGKMRRTSRITRSNTPSVDDRLSVEHHLRHVRPCRLVRRKRVPIAKAVLSGECHVDFAKSSGVSVFVASVPNLMYRLSGTRVRSRQGRKLERLSTAVDPRQRSQTGQDHVNRLGALRSKVGRWFQRRITIHLWQVRARALSAGRCRTRQVHRAAKGPTRVCLPAEMVFWVRTGVETMLCSENKSVCYITQ